MLTKRRLPLDRWRLPSQIGNHMKLWLKQTNSPYIRWRLRLYCEPDLSNALYIVAARSGQAGSKEIEL